MTQTNGRVSEITVRLNATLSTSGADADFFTHAVDDIEYLLNELLETQQAYQRVLETNRAVRAQAAADAAAVRALAERESRLISQIDDLVSERMLRELEAAH